MRQDKTQLDKLHEALAAIVANVSPDDRKALIKKGICSGPTLIDYLKGRGRKLSTGIKILKFLRERIAERERMLAEAA